MTMGNERFTPPEIFKNFEKRQKNKEKEPSFPTFSQALEKSLDDVNGCQGNMIPQVSKNYLEIQNQLIKFEKKGVTAFNGGPLDLRKEGIENIWLNPIEVRDEEGFSNFHVIFINCSIDEDLSSTPIHLDLTPEIDLKLRSNNKMVNNFDDLLLKPDPGPNSKKIIIRPSVTGSLAYPLITTPLDVPSEEKFKERLSKLTNSLGVSFDVENHDYKALQAQKFELGIEFGSFILSKPRIVETELGVVRVYGVMSSEDPWRYYEIFSFKPLNDIKESNNKTQINNETNSLFMRTDSGCDIGMLYHDEGCDCHSQLLHALKEAKESDGIVLHIPTQDGRGYGMNTKVETEGYKRGIETTFNKGKGNMRTLEAAEFLFGNKLLMMR
jgi:GTP cyclohydrolase II